MSITAFVFARGGSKGLPRKNLLPLAGRPLLAWSVEVAMACPSISRVIVSTDDDEIEAAALTAGAEVPFRRPSELAADEAPEWFSYQHALRTMAQLEPDTEIPVFLSLPPTAPLRAPEDVENCLTRLAQGDVDIVIGGTPAERNPYFNIMRLDDEGHAHCVCKPDRPLSRRQDAPICYDLTTVAFAAKPEFILASSSLFEGTVGMVEVPRERAMDIDELMDLKVAEMLLESR